MMKYHGTLFVLYLFKQTEVTVGLIELIQVRSFSETDKQEAVNIFKNLSLDEPEVPSKMRLLGNQTQPTDLSIHLYWDNAQAHPFKSAFGEKLAAAFKYFGWISHTIWKPLEEKL